MLDRYKLIGRLPVPCADLHEWAVWFGTADRVVAKTTVGGLLEVSTVFLGLDHNFSGVGSPALFETMIFDAGDDGYQTRCTTWDEAERMHAAAEVVACEWLARAKAAIKGCPAAADSSDGK